MCFGCAESGTWYLQLPRQFSRRLRVSELKLELRSGRRLTLGRARRAETDVFYQQYPGLRPSTSVERAENLEIGVHQPTPSLVVYLLWRLSRHGVRSRGVPSHARLTGHRCRLKFPQTKRKTKKKKKKKRKKKPEAPRERSHRSQITSLDPGFLHYPYGLDSICSMEPVASICEVSRAANVSSVI